MASNNPMDYIHPIIQAYISSQQLQQRQREHLAQVEQEQKDRELRERQFMETAASAQRDQRLREKAQQSADEFREFQAIELIRKSIKEGDRIPPLPLNTPAMETEFGTMPGGRSWRETVPGVGALELENVALPSDKNAQAVEAFRAMTEPTVERAGKVAAIETEKQLAALIQAGKNQVALEGAKATNQTALEILRDTHKRGQIKLQGENADRRQRIANQGRMAAATAGLSNPTAFGHFISQAAQGDLSLEEINTQIPIRQRDAFQRAAEAAGVIALPKRTLQGVESLGTIQDVYLKYLDVADAAERNNYPEYLVAVQAAKTVLGNFTKKVGGNIGAQSDQDIKRAEGSIPGFFTEKFVGGTNEKRIKSLKDYIQREMKIRLGPMKEDQRQLMIDRYSLDPNFAQWATPEFEQPASPLAAPPSPPNSQAPRRGFDPSKDPRFERVR